MPEIGTCPVCGRRFATFRLLTTGTLVLLHHNSEPKTRCEGAGGSPLEGSLSYQVAGRRIARDTQRDG